MISASCVIAQTLCVQSSFGADLHWASPTDGIWSSSLSWTPSQVPSEIDNAILGHTLPYTSRIIGLASVSSLIINNNAASLVLEEHANLSVFGDVHSEGSIRLIVTDAFGTPRLRFRENGSFLGTGSIRLSSGMDRNAFLSSSDGVTVGVGAEFTITGDGRIDTDLSNAGAVHADTPGEPLAINARNLLNSGDIAALNGGKLLLDKESAFEKAPLRITQESTGMIRVSGEGSLLEFGLVQITGGTIEGSDQGEFNFLDYALFRDTTFRGHLTFTNRTWRSRLSGDLHNDGLITIRHDCDVEMLYGTYIGGKGEIQVDGQLFGYGDIGSGQLVRGTGLIKGLRILDIGLTNHGEFRSTVKGEVLEIRDVTNNGQYTVNPGTTMRLSGLSIQSQGATLDILGDGRLELSDYVQRIHIAPNAGGQCVVLGDTQIDEFVNESHVSLISGGVSQQGRITNHGLISMQTPGEGSGWIRIQENAELFGRGTLSLTGGFIDRWHQSTDHHLIHGSAHTINGSGEIRCSLVNFGTVQGDDQASPIHMHQSDSTNHGIIRARSGGSLLIDDIRIDQSENGTLSASGLGSMLELHDATVHGGTIRCDDPQSSLLLTGASRIDSTHIEGILTIPAGGTCTIGEDIHLTGTLSVESSTVDMPAELIFDAPLAMTSKGATVRLSSSNGNARLDCTDQLTALETPLDLTITGEGQIDCDVENNGTIAPGNGIGVLEMDGLLDLKDNGVLKIELNAESGDRIESQSDVILGGTLLVEYIDGFIPVGCWQRAIIQTAFASGVFDAVSLPQIQEGLVIRVSHRNGEIIIGEYCPADFNLDLVVDIFDVFAFIDAFEAGNDAADVDQNGVTDVFDLFSYLTIYGTSCTATCGG
jgi:hypothetical protein